MTEDRHTPNEELNRAILADGIARLEKQLDAAEKRARDAEAAAKEAKSALAEVLLDKARGQKAAPASAHHASPGDHEAQALRAELASARHELQQQESKIQDARDDAAEELRLEYERRFHAARERMAHEFQKRLTDAESALALDAKRQSAAEDTGATRDIADPRAPGTPAVSNAEQTPAAAPRPGIFGMCRLEGVRRHPFAVPLAAFAGGLLLGWSALHERGVPETAVAKDMPPAVESAPAAQAVVQQAISAATEPAQTIEPAPAAPAQFPPSLPTVAEAPPAAAEPSRPGSAADNVAEPVLTQPAKPVQADAQSALEAHDASSSAAADELRQQLESMSKRAKSAEAALGAERRKSAELARRVAAAERAREERARADDAAAANRPQRPEPGPSGAQEPPSRSPLYFRIE